MQSELVPGPRSVLPKLCAVGVAAVSVVTATYMFGEWALGWVSMAMLLLSLGPLVHGFFLFLEEKWNHSNRYRGRSFMTCLSDCGLLRSVLCVVLSALLLRFSGSPLPLPQLWTLLWLCAALYAPFRTLGPTAPCEVEISDICETRRMNVAHGLAWSFYLGYLSLVLPRLEDAISSFCASHQKSASLWSRGSKRLFILIPINANISHKLDDEDERIQFLDSLPNSQLDRGGVRNRVYKHSVYRVFNHKGQAHDCVVEYATPLLTLYSMSQDSSAGFGEPERRQQVLLFYRTLRDILERSLDCRNKYTLILLNDEHEGDPHYLSKTLLRQLQQQNTEEYPMFPSPHTPPPHLETHPLHTRPFTAPGQHARVHANHKSENTSPEPTLMFSLDHPKSLRGPVETTEHFNPRRSGYS